MTQMERYMNILRFGDEGDCVESKDGSIRITRKDRFVNTLPTCYITENGHTRESIAFNGDVVVVLKKLIEIDEKMEEQEKMTEETKNKLFYIADRLDEDYKNGDSKDKYSIGKRDGVFMVLYAFDLMDDFKAWQENK